GLGESSVRWDDYSAAATGSDMLALIRAHGGGPAYLVGTSIAGSAAVWAAAEATELIAGLVLIGSGVGKMGGSRWLTYLMHLMYRPLFVRPWGPVIWLRYYASLYPAARPADWAAYTARLRRNLREPGRLAAMRRQVFALPDSASQAAARLRRV